MLFLVDISMMVRRHHSMSTSEDDVPSWILHKLETVREWFEGRFSVEHFVCAFDNPNRLLYRHVAMDAIGIEYKAGRTKDEEIPQIESDTLTAVDHDSDWQAIVAPAMFEADDVCASLAAQYAGKVFVHSLDRDYHSMIEKGRVQIVKKTVVEEPGAPLTVEFFNADAHEEKYGFGPERWLDYQCMVGGKDNVPGWDRVGQGMATKIIQAGVDLDEIDIESEDLKLNKAQRASYETFRRQLPAIRLCNQLQTSLPVSIKSREAMPY